MKRVQTPAGEAPARLVRHLSPLGLWALSFGCAVGWGAFAMPGNTFLPIAGPLGIAIGMFVGGLIMLLIGLNYHYLMNRYPDAGGTFHYVKEVFGYDHGFLSAWFWPSSGPTPPPSPCSAATCSGACSSSASTTPWPASTCISGRSSSPWPPS